MCTDVVPKKTQIHVDNLALAGKKGFHSVLCATPLKRYQPSVPDFSYLMILELKDFYCAKFKAFRKCMQSCEELCDCAYQLSVDLDQPLESISIQAQASKNVATQEMQFHINNFGEDMRSEILYITEELIRIGNIICPLYQDINPNINLENFTENLGNLAVRRENAHLHYSSPAVFFF